MALPRSRQIPASSETLLRTAANAAGSLAIWRASKNALASFFMSSRKGLEVFEGCALPAALEAMGERWSFMILRAAFNGIVYFEDFQSTLGIARNILSNRLAKLVANGILSREPVPSDKRRVAYRLTEKGMGLVPVMIALRQWGERWSGMPPTGPILADCRDHRPVRPITIQAWDGRMLGHGELCWVERECSQAGKALARPEAACAGAARDGVKSD